MDKAATATVAPEMANPSAPTSLAIITDYGNCDTGEQQVADMVGSWGVQAIATAGDNTQGVVNCVPYTESVGKYYGAYVVGPDGPRLYPVPGNHDYTNAGAGEKAYVSYFNYLYARADHPLWYSATIGSVNLFMLDSESSAADLTKQQTWLKSALDTARKTTPNNWNIVVYHRPAYTSGPHEANTAMRTDAGWKYRQWGADLVVTGHQHVYEQLDVDGLPYIVGGVGAGDIARECPAERVRESRLCVSGDGAIKLDASEGTLSLEYRRPDGGQGSAAATLELSHR